MMGDNRDNSTDSRDEASVGPVPFENFVGRAEIIFFSIDEDACPWKVWEWPASCAGAACSSRSGRARGAAQGRNVERPRGAARPRVSRPRSPRPGADPCRAPPAARRRGATSGSSSSATGCSALRRRHAVSPLPRGARGRPVPPPGGARAPGDLRRRRAAHGMLGPHLRLGAGEVQSGGRRNQAILADACEAVIGAVFLDGGYAAAKELVERAFGERVSAPRRPAARRQDRAAGMGAGPRACRRRPMRSSSRSAPTTRRSSGSWSRCRAWRAASASAASKRVAEQEAARSLLLREGVWTEDEHGAA